MSITLRMALAGSLATLALVAMTNCAMPGTTLGLYTVTGDLTTNTCGAGLQAPDPWSFNVELSETSTKLYWNTMDGSGLLSGTRSGSSVTLDATTSANVDGVDGSTGPCNMTRTDTLKIELSSEATPKSFSGTISYVFSVASGSNCSDQLSSSGGTYDALPCTISYALTGSHE